MVVILVFDSDLSSTAYLYKNNHCWNSFYELLQATEIIGKEYDQKCSLLRHQFAQDLKTQVIDKTRATVKDLYSRLKVAIHAVNSISMRIEKLRDEELQPQLFELIQGYVLYST